MPGEPGQRMSIAGPWKWPEHQTLRISTGKRCGTVMVRRMRCRADARNVLIRLVGYVLAQGSPSVQMTVRDDADERVWWDGMPRRRGSLGWASVRHDEHGSATYPMTPECSAMITEPMEAAGGRTGVDLSIWM